MLTQESELEPYKCSICQQVVRAVDVTKGYKGKGLPTKLKACGHLFCLDCLNAYVESIQPSKATGEVKLQ